ncbi:MAG: minor capsid protein [Proteobacteria bacterium]|nr:minor capsid protein [Pseudomonadota bacterium]
MADPVELKALPPAEAIAFFRQKGYRLTYSYRDLMQAGHSDAFTVAGVSRLDVLQDVRSAVDEAVSDGSTFAEFKQAVRQKLASKGWWGPVQVKDPATGETKTVDLSRSRRLRTIFDTNLRTAYAAGHWQRLQRNKDIMPFLRYSAVLDSRTRPMHRRWGDPKFPVILPVEHPWWQTHLPPNGWNCRCTVVPMTAAQVDRAGLHVMQDGPYDGPDQTVVNERTGETFKVPPGVDPSFGYNVGETAHFPDPAKYSEPELAREAARLSVQSRNFSRLVAGEVRGTAPVSWVDDTLQAALNADVRRVDLSSDTLAKQSLNHPELTLEDYRQLPMVIGEGIVVADETDASIRILGLLDGDRPVIAVVKRTGTGRALFVVTFYRLKSTAVAAALAEVPIRDNAALRALLAR